MFLQTVTEQLLKLFDQKKFEAGIGRRSPWESAMCINFCRVKLGNVLSEIILQIRPLIAIKLNKI